MTKLEPGDRMPSLTARSLDGAPVELPEHVLGSWSILLFYRGHW